MIGKGIKVESQVEFRKKDVTERRGLVENLVLSVGRYAAAL